MARDICGVFMLLVDSISESVPERLLTLTYSLRQKVRELVRVVVVVLIYSTSIEVAEAEGVKKRGAISRAVDAILLA